jgi:hypothetical protein
MLLPEPEAFVHQEMVVVVVVAVVAVVPLVEAL